MKTFSTLIILFIGSIIGFFVGALVISNGELETEKKEWLSSLGELKNQLPELVTDEVSQLFPLEVQDLGDTIQLTTASPPEVLSKFLSGLGTMSSDDLPEGEEVVELRQQISDKVNQLSPFRRQIIADQIELADWSLSALELLASQQADGELLIDLVLAQSVVDTAPDDAPDWLVGNVREHTNSLIGQARAKIQELAKSSTSADLEALRSGLLLADWMNQSDLLEEASFAELEISLRVKIWESRVEGITRGAYGSDEEYDIARGTLIEDGSVILESAANQRTPLPEGFLEKLRSFSESLASEQRKAQQRRQAEYQLWAISNIQKANKLIGDAAPKLIDEWLSEAKDFPENEHFKLLGHLESYPSSSFRRALLEAVYEDPSMNKTFNKYDMPTVVENLDKTIGWKNQSDMAKSLTADALIRHLMVIDEAYLDRPVAALYSDAFQKAWTYLEGTDIRMDVAQTAATILKKNPGDDLEN